MKLRYIVFDVKLDSDHPYWPSQLMYKIKDLHTGNILYGCYTKQEVANSVAKAKNEEQV